jgi:hypothetical protein
MQWVCCVDTMPPKDTQVLACGPGRGDMIGGVNMDIGVWDGKCWWDEGGTEMTWRDPTFTHWMPLPDPPRSVMVPQRLTL